jgi:hypothetical protein
MAYSDLFAHDSSPARRTSPLTVWSQSARVQKSARLQSRGTGLVSGGMQRRAFIMFLGGAVASWPIVAAAQSDKLARVGVLMLGTPDPGLFLREFREGLRELGYAEGRNIALELRNANGSAATLKAHARELAAMKVDAIVGFQTPAAIAAKEATKDVPIVMCPAADPIGTGLVKSFARPGGNITGVTTATAEIAGRISTSSARCCLRCAASASSATRTTRFTSRFSSR